MNSNFIRCWRRKLRKAAYIKKYRNRSFCSVSNSLREVFIILNSNTNFRNK